MLHKPPKPKKRWGSVPHLERGGLSWSEAAYVHAMTKAHERGKSSAFNPKATTEWCPRAYNEDERSYWLAGFNEQRRRV